MACLAWPEPHVDLLAGACARRGGLVTAHQQAAGRLSEAERCLASLKSRADQLVVALKT